MAGLIPQSFIDDLLDRLDIVEVVDSRVKLKRSGKNYAACCPFHEEKSPSFTVSPDKQFFYCFGCGASGNALGFVMDYERLSFPEAVENLAHIAGLEVPREVQSEAQVKREQEKKSIYTLLERADIFYQQQLRTHQSKHLAVDYLKKRGLDGKTAKSYGVGFAPPGWDNLLKALAQTEEDKRLLIEGGMLIHQEQDKKLYDRFRHRVMFPIRDARGRVIGFGGRVLGDDKPKYLNSPETPVFHKGQELYGLYEARLAYRELPRLLVVEGYMDVVSLAQFGIGYGVATLGTACGPDHLERAFKHTSEVVFCFDGDKAGRTAAIRALDACLESMNDGRTVKFLFLPDGEDPDTLIRSIGAEKFERMIDLSVPLEDYLFDAVADGLNLRTMDGRATFSRRAAPLINRLPKGVFRELMFDSLATRTGLSRKTLNELIETDVAAPTDFLRGETTKTAEQLANEPQHVRADLSSPIQPPPIQDWQPIDLPPASDNLPPADYDQFFTTPTTYQRIHDKHAANAHSQHQQTAQSSRGRYLLPPAKRGLTLLLTEPHLAQFIEISEAELTQWEAHSTNDLRQFSRLLRLLKDRPHYKQANIFGYWRGAYGANETEHIATIAAHDLIGATHEITKEDDNRPAKAEFNGQQALNDTVLRIRDLLIKQQKNTALEHLRQTDTSQLSREERIKLINNVLGTP